MWKVSVWIWVPLEAELKDLNACRLFGKRYLEIPTEEWGREMRNIERPIKNVLSNQFPLWVTGAQSYWRALKDSVGHTSEVSHWEARELGRVPTDMLSVIDSGLLLLFGFALCCRMVTGVCRKYPSAYSNKCQGDMGRHLVTMSLMKPPTMFWTFWLYFLSKLLSTT